VTRSTRFRCAPFLLLLLLAVGLGTPLGAQEVLSNQNVIELTQAGVDAAVIVNTIESSRTRFEMGVQQIVALSGANVHRDVIAAMQGAVARGGQPKAGMGARSAVEFALPTEFGAYIAQSEQADRMPGSGLSARELKDRQGKVIERYLALNEPAVARQVAVHSPSPTFIVFLRDAAASGSIRLFPVDWSPAGVLTATIKGDAQPIPVRMGPAGNDPRHVRVTPEADLPVGVYALIYSEAPRTAHLVFRVRGEVDPASLDGDLAATLQSVGNGTLVGLDVSADEARALVMQTLEREKLSVVRPFDENGMLLTRPEIRAGGFLGRNTNREQYAVLVQSTGTGSVVRVLADVWKSGTPDGAVSAATLRTMPLERDHDGNSKRAESLAGELRKNAQRAARGR
jgi:hypothetical protein